VEMTLAAPVGVTSAVAGAFVCGAGGATAKYVALFAVFTAAICSEGEISRGFVPSDGNCSSEKLGANEEDSVNEGGGCCFLGGRPYRGVAGLVVASDAVVAAANLLLGTMAVTLKTRPAAMATEVTVVVLQT